MGSQFIERFVWERKKLEPFGVLEVNAASCRNPYAAGAVL